MKNKKIVKKLFAGVMAASLCLGTCLVTSNVAVAAPPEEGAKVSLTKELKVANGIQSPEATFTFNFEQADGKYTGEDDQQYDAVSKDDVATIKSINLKFAKGEDNTSGKIVKESTNIVAEDRCTFPHAGVYKFIVSEKEGETTVPNDAGNGTMTYATNRYIMFVSVMNDGNGGLVVDKVIVQPEDPENPGEPTGGKTDGTPGKDENDNVVPEEPTDDKDDDTNLAGTGNEFLFVNTYTKTTGGDTPDPTPDDPDPDDPSTSALIVQKIVEGDRANLAQQFDFYITLTAPETATETEVTAYITDKDGKVRENTTINLGERTHFNLAHNEYLGFKKLPAGTTYVVEENWSENFTGAVITTTNNVAGSEKTGAEKETLVAEKAVVGEMVGQNSAVVTNTFDDASTTPTGIIVNNLPYVALILVAIIGCVVVVASRKRRMS